MKRRYTIMSSPWEARESREHHYPRQRSQRHIPDFERYRRQATDQPTASSSRPPQEALQPTHIPRRPGHDLRSINETWKRDYPSAGSSYQHSLPTKDSKGFHPTRESEQPRQTDSHLMPRKRVSIDSEVHTLESDMTSLDSAMSESTKTFERLYKEVKNIMHKQDVSNVLHSL